MKRRIETRRGLDLPAIVCRRDDAEAPAASEQLTGYAAIYFDGSPGSQFELAPGVYERLVRGCFDRAVRERHDARGLLNHDPNMLLGRVSAGTMRLTVDDRGLKYTLDVPESWPGPAVLEAAARGDLTGSSFAFIPTRTIWVDEGDTLIREVHDVELIDCSPTTFPAYAGTSVGVGSGRRKRPTASGSSPEAYARLADSMLMVANA